MPMTSRVTEVSTVVGFIASNSGATASSPWLSNAISLDCDTGRRLVADINVGTIGSSATVTGKFQYATASGGSYSDITGTNNGGDTAGSQVDTIEILVEDVKNSYPTATYVKLSVAVATAATPFGATIRSFDPAHIPITAGTSQGIVTVLP